VLAAHGLDWEKSAGRAKIALREDSKQGGLPARAKHLVSRALES
jgi:hypothetical protein